MPVEASKMMLRAASPTMSIWNEPVMEPGNGFLMRNDSEEGFLRKQSEFVGKRLVEDRSSNNLPTISLLWFRSDPPLWPDHADNANG